MRFGIRELIFVLVLLAVPAGAFHFVFRPQQDDIKVIEQRNEMMLGKLQRLNELTDRVPDLQAEIDRGQEAIELMEAKLPARQDVEHVLENVWQIAERNQQRVRSVKTQPPVPTAAYMELSLDVEMEGHFNGFYQFLFELEQLSRITRIHDMKVTSAAYKDSKSNRNRQRQRNRDNTEEIPPGSMRAEFTLSIYFEGEATLVMEPNS